MTMFFLSSFCFSYGAAAAFVARALASSSTIAREFSANLRHRDVAHP